jgi:hypothetical protein
MADDLITVAQYQFLPEAEAARMHLEAEGIPATLSDAETVNMDWLLGNAIGYIKLVVPRGQAEAALAVLEGARSRQGAAEDVLPEDPEGSRCLACGASLSPELSTCAACGWSYAEEEGESPSEAPAVGRREDESAPDEGPTGLDRLRSWKRPLFLVLLSPVIAGAALLALGLFVWLVGRLVP